jgi:hypothetical protein
MRGPLTRTVALAALACLLLALPGCGGSSSDATSSSSASGLSSGESASSEPSASSGSSQGSRQLPGHPKIAARPHPPPSGPQRTEGGARYGTLTRASAVAAERKAERRERAVNRKLARKAGAAAPFLVKEGDNSIPTYGSEASAAQLASAEAVLSRYLGARAAGEWGPACAQMSAGVQKQLALLGGENGGDCAFAYAKLAERIPAPARVDPLVDGLAALRVESPHAFALFYGPGSQQYMVPLEEEGGGWKVTQLEPVPWPVGTPAH